METSKEPVDINGVTFDALIDETLSLDADAPTYPVETGFEVSDAIILKPKMLKMTLFVTNTPVTWYDKHGGNPSRVADVVEKLKEVYYSRETVTVITSDEVYENMAILNIVFTKSKELGKARQIPIMLKEIIVTESRVGTIPDSFGRGGDTGVIVGSASVTQSPSPSPPAASQSDGSRGSVLHGIASGAGLLGNSGGGVGGLLGGIGRG